jgi:hypothetical protein
MLRPSAAAVLIAVLAGAPPALAQFGNIFGNEPPRPPGSVPGGRAPAPPQAPELQQALPPPPRGGGIESQPLPPPPAASAPSSPPPQQATRPPAQLPPAQQPAQPGAPEPPAAPPARDEVVTEMPTQKINNPSAIFAGLDKITGRIISFDVSIGETVQFGALQVTPRVCYTRPPTETPNTDAFIEVDEVTLQGEVKRIFTGWMFAASPGLHAVEHPIYDVWLTDCKGGAPAVTAEAPPEPQAQPQRPAQRQQPQRRVQPPAQRPPDFLPPFR